MGRGATTWLSAVMLCGATAGCAEEVAPAAEPRPAAGAAGAVADELLDREDGLGVVVQASVPDAIVIKTSKDAGAGTDARVWLAWYGTRSGWSSFVALPWTRDDTDSDEFTRYSYPLIRPQTGETVTRLRLSRDNSGILHPEWKVDYVRLNNGINRTCTFNQWIPAAPSYAATDCR